MSTQLSKIIEYHFGVEPLNFSHMTFGHSSSAVYSMGLPQSEIILKINKDAKALEGIEHNLMVLSQLGLPVSKILYSDMSCLCFEAAYVILGKIPGTDLRYEIASMTKAQMTILAEQIVTFQEQVMTLAEGQGFGWVPVGQVGPFTSWADIIRHDLEKGKLTLEALVENKLYQHITRLAQPLENYFTKVRPVCFLDDVTTKNIIVQNGQLQGLVDFDVVCYGDPLFWLSLTQTAVFADVGEVGQFYVDELMRFWKVDANKQRIVQFYCLLQAMDFVSFAIRNNDGDMAKRLLEWMNLLAKRLEAY